LYLFHLPQPYVYASLRHQWEQPWLSVSAVLQVVLPVPPVLMVFRLHTL
jgi:hypothetical protein